MALSPKVDQSMQQPSADQEGQIFEQQFSEMAQSMLMSKLPQLAQDVATFKIVDADIDSGSAVGSFILQRPTGMLYIPVVLSENQIKPMEIIYSQEHDVFVPLNPEWLEELERGSLDTLGRATKTPQSLYSDVDIRNLVVPPTTGRYSYASAKDLQLPEFLAQADNSIKEKFAHVLQADRELLKTAVAIYGSKALTDAMRPHAEKVAAAKPATEELAIVNADSTPKQFKDIFGDEAPAAMRGVSVKGYYTKDTRKNLNHPINEEATVKLEAINSTGAFKVFKKSGQEMVALVFHRPTALHSDDFSWGHKTPKSMKYDRYAGPKKTTDHIESRSPNTEIGVLGADGTYHKLQHCIIGEPLQIGELEGKAGTALEGEAKPKSGRGIFVRRRGTRIEGTEPVEIESVTTGSDGVTRCKAKAGFYHEITIVIDPKSGYGRIQKSQGHIVVIPSDFKWVSVKVEDVYENCPFVKDPAGLTVTKIQKLKEAGAEVVHVKKASDDDYSIGGTSFNGTRAQTVIKLARDYRISVPHAEEVTKLADAQSVARVVVASLDSLKKLAAEDEKKKDHKKKTTVTEEPAVDPNAQAMAEQGGDPAAQGQDPAMQGGDPSMQGGDPAMQGQPPMDPSMMGGPSPTDQAVMELQEEVQRAHEEQMKLLQHKLDALQMVAQRTQEITQGVPKDQSVAIQQAVSTASQGAPQGQAPAPVGNPGATPGMDPSAVAGAAPQGAGMPGQAQPGQDPSMQGGQPGQPPMDPNAPVDPAMMQQASGLQDPEMFDAAAIGSLAEHSSLKDLISNYLPTLEKSVDHLGRILLTVWIKGTELRKEMGEENYTALEDRLRNMFRGMGDVVLRLNKNSLILNENGSDLSYNDAA
jgi:hypothetical protein